MHLINIKFLTGYSSFLQVLTYLMIPSFVLAHGDASFQNLKGLKAPIVAGLTSGQSAILTDPKVAIQLGKALFWDMHVGSDGVACGSCHFHAGADRRSRNQINSGFLHTTDPMTAIDFNINASIQGGPDYELKASDFPLFRFADPADKQSSILFSTDDVVGSAGAFMQQFQTVNATGDGTDNCGPKTDPVFHINELNTRQTTKRNTPTIINAAFNFRNFWDGRANNIFNGETAFGLRDTNAKVWVATSPNTAKKISIKLANAALASQAVAPPLDMMEMSCQGRTFHDLGKKLLHRRPLETQSVHSTDSVLGQLRHNSGSGLNTNYNQLIKKAFNNRYWSAKGDFGRSTSGVPYSQMEANFAFFFGLAIQAYESTLISDQTIFDAPLTKDGFPEKYNDTQKRGLTVFNDAHCNICHSGPTFSAAANPEILLKAREKLTYHRLVDRTSLGEQSDKFGVDNTLIDLGFTVTSVAPTDYDIGLGGKDPFGNPLSFAEQYLAVLADPSKKMLDPVKVVTCEFDNPFSEDFNGSEWVADKLSTGICKTPSEKSIAKVPSPAIVNAELTQPNQGRLSVATKSAFKIPTLRNIELTGPYMHNGSMKSLEEVVDFYNRGGNFSNQHHFSTLVFPQGFTQQNKKDLVAFLKTLTDERVRWEKAPFDHPGITVTHGHQQQANMLGTGLANDRYIKIPAVGKNGRTKKQGPLMPFDSFLKP
jgi:cytochrome c peroxidase